jgi:DNA replication and repair protein RecF
VAHVEAAWHQGVKRFKVNGVAQTRMSDVLGHLQVVLFSPEDVELVSGTAAVRRRFLDMALSPLDPLYLDALQQYRQVLRQRNEVIRSDQPGTALLDAWDQQLARYGGTLSQRRARFLGDLAARAALVHQQIAPEETVAIEYKPDIRYDEDLLDVLQRSRPHDIRRGATSRGPHRDDFAIVIGAGPARSFASQGQQRTLTLAVKLALVQVVRDAVGEVPVLMLDEVFSELDEQRSRRLIDTIDPDVQCLLTTTDLTRSWWDNGVVSAEFLMERGRLEKR